MPRLIRLKVHPGEKEDRIVERGPDAFEVWVRAPAERGLANAACRALLARHLGVEVKRVRILRGTTSPSKIATILG